jgi:D-alanyl-D-alanine carboxypeptidase/D-alanyl-D-alanine-endopeptidase (penicillin-binding protein 4)
MRAGQMPTNIGVARRVLIIACAAASLGVSGVSRATSLSLESMRAHVLGLVHTPCFQEGRIGLQAMAVETGQVLLDFQGDAVLMPASTLKLLTSAVALHQLSPQYRFRTAFLSTHPIQQGIIQGDLVLKGYGDPVLVVEEAWLMARALRREGLREVDGDLVGDESFFDAERRGMAWADPSSQRAFNAKIGALSLNFNSVMVLARPGRHPGDPLEVEVDPGSAYLTLQNGAKTGREASGSTISVTRQDGEHGDTLRIEGSLARGSSSHTVYRNISNPPLYATMVMRDLLQHEGIRITGRARVGLTPPQAREVYVHHSKPLYRIIDDLNKYSNNLIAEHLLKTLGAEVHGPPGTWENGLAVTHDVLTAFGIPRGALTLADGSGLSRSNRVSPAHLVTVLRHMAQDFRLQPEYFASLRTPDIEGRSSQRFHGAALGQRARVKTGSLDDVSALAGYVEPLAGGLVAFAVLMNGPFCSIDRAWQVQDALVERLIDLSYP